MYGKEIRAWRPKGEKALVADANGVYNMVKNTAFRIVITTADVWMRLSNNREDLVANPADDTDILLQVGEHIVDVGPKMFMSISTPDNANVIQIEPI